LGGSGIGGPGNRAANYQLRQIVDNGLVMPEPEFNKNFTAWVERGEMSDAMKLMIKRSGYGAKPSEFWRKQWERQYNGAPMDPKHEQVIPMRDQMKVSYNPGPAGGPNPVAQVAMAQSNFFRNLATGAVNALTMTAPAAAGEMPMGAMGQVRIGAPVVGTSKLNANAKAWLAAISAGGFEGAGYNTYYGGGAFDNTKGHPMRVVRPAGGIPSSAAGRYQFMPDTWTGLHGGKNPPMTPANQDAGAYQLALNRGVDLNTAPVTIENVRKLAPVWAALPVSATSGAGYYKGQGGAGFARFRQTWETERRRYSAGA
jgi:muramidase (phage lysozyme)